MIPATTATKRFCLILVKPSHYDDDGYVIQWFRSTIPSNSLAAVYGLARDCALRKTLGEDVAIEIHPFDETNTRIRPEKLARMIEEAGAGMVMLIGVQSNQFPHALDLAKPLRDRGIQVGIGGFHVSGILSMMGGNDTDVHRAKAMGVSLFAGEAEGRMELVLNDAYAKKLKPLYNFMADLPNIEGEPLPLIPAIRAARTAGEVTSFDAGRGCPFQCSFCTIIDVQGRKSRRRSPDDLERLIRENVAQGLNRFFITDDNFARNKDWEKIPRPADSPAPEREDQAVVPDPGGQLPLDILEFFFLTPLPGSEDHQTLVNSGVVVDPDLNKYDLNHVCAPHPKMTREDWEKVYRKAWETYYTNEHMEAVIRRLVSREAPASNAIMLIAWFWGAIQIEKIHPLETGLFRYKFRRDRRPGFPIEPIWKFYPKYAVESVVKLAKWGALYSRLRAVCVRVKKDPNKLAFMDLAMTPVTDDEDLEMFHTPSAPAFLEQEHRRQNANAEAREPAAVA